MTTRNLVKNIESNIENSKNSKNEEYAKIQKEFLARVRMRAVKK